MKTIAKHILFFIIASAEVLLFMIVAGEESPNEPMPFEKFFLLKFGALAGMYIFYRIGKVLYNAGLFPDHIYKEIEEEEI